MDCPPGTVSMMCCDPAPGMSPEALRHQHVLNHLATREALCPTGTDPEQLAIWGAKRDLYETTSRPQNRGGSSRQAMPCIPNPSNSFAPPHQRGMQYAAAGGSGGYPPGTQPMGQMGGAAGCPPGTMPMQARGAYSPPGGQSMQYGGAYCPPGTQPMQTGGGYCPPGMEPMYGGAPEMRQLAGGYADDDIPVVVAPQETIRTACVAMCPPPPPVQVPGIIREYFPPPRVLCDPIVTSPRPPATILAAPRPTPEYTPPVPRPPPQQPVPPPMPAAQPTCVQLQPAGPNCGPAQPQGGMHTPMRTVTSYADFGGRFSNSPKYDAAGSQHGYYGPSDVAQLLARDSRATHCC
ncbi:hypothetical protein DIPPA_32958 [Diplonema papillatum]|nr:hypothetical protein DIPPA_32958 [Diplonema papillatum]